MAGHRTKIAKLPLKTTKPAPLVKPSPEQEEENEAAFFKEFRSVLDGLYDYQEMIEMTGDMFKETSSRTLEELFEELKDWKPMITPKAWRNLMREQRDGHSEECAKAIMSMSKGIEKMMKRETGKKA